MDPVHGTSAETTDASGAGQAGPAGVPPVDQGLDVHFARLKEAGSAWISVKRDQAAIRVKRLVLISALGFGVAIAAASLVFVSIFLVLGGVTDLFANTLHLSSGVAAIMVGGSILVLGTLAAWLISRRLKQGWSDRLGGGHAASRSPS